MLPRVLEPEVMDSPEEARDYDAMDHAQVNERFVAEFLAFGFGGGRVLDVGTGTAQIPIELCRRHPGVSVIGIDLAEHMLGLGRDNVARAGFGGRIELQRVDAKAMPFGDGSFDAVMSNSIVHHIPAPADAFREMARVSRRGSVLFVRDLMRPDDDEAVRGLVQLYASGANAHQRKMFDDSLRAALRVDEVRDVVVPLGFPPDSVRATSDRHWTWAVRKP